MNDQEHAFVFGTSEEIMSKQYIELNSDQKIIAGDEYLTIGDDWLTVKASDVGAHVGPMRIRRLNPAQSNTTSYRTKSPHECVCLGDQYCHVAHGWIPVPVESLGKCVGFTQVREPFQNPPEAICPKPYPPITDSDCNKLTEKFMDHLKELEIERGKVYGDPRKSHANIGLSWTALIQQHFGITLDHPIPDYLAAQMLVAFKNQRSCRVFKDDNYDDAAVYLGFARRFQQGKD